MGLFRRPLLVHYHIYKNAGTSVEKNLSDSFGSRWATYEGDAQSFRLTSKDVEAFAKANPDICAVSSHKARPFRAPKRFFPIVFLRHPIDRARSVYGFTRRDPTQFDHPLARDCSFEIYVNWWLDRPSSALRNYQVIHLSQASFRVADIADAAPSGVDLSEALDFLSSLRFFGLVRRYQESCQGFEACYRRIFADLRMSWVRENPSTGELLGESAALQVAREELGERTYARLLEANRLDLALYEAAVEMFELNLARISERGLRRASLAFLGLLRGNKGARRPFRWAWAAP